MISKIDRRKLSACRSGKLKTTRSVSAVSIATSEYLLCPPRFREGRGFQHLIASLRDPHCDVTAFHECTVVGGPVRDSITCPVIRMDSGVSA